MRDISKAAKLVRAYVEAEAADIRGDENIGPMPGIYLAVLQAVSYEEAADLGAALLCRNESLADRSFKFGGAMYDSRLQALADALGWAP
jgi:hypothetical protein